MGQMGPMGQHFHVHLDVLVDGKPVPVVPDLGIDTGSGAMADLHTHDGSGVLHIEAMKNHRYNLGQLFAMWNVRLDATHLGGLTAGPSTPLAAYVNGKPVAGDPAAIELARHQEIALIYGPAGGPRKVPSTYAFPSGE